MPLPQNTEGEAREEEQAAGETTEAGFTLCSTIDEALLAAITSQSGNGDRELRLLQRENVRLLEALRRQRLGQP